MSLSNRELARAYEANQRWAEAAAAWREHLLDSPKDQAAKRNSLVCSARNAENTAGLREALNSWQTILRIFPHDELAQRSIWRCSAGIEEDNSEWEAAAIHWKTALNAFPADPLFTRKLARCLAEIAETQGDWPAAAKEWSTAGQTGASDWTARRRRRALVMSGDADALRNELDGSNTDVDVLLDLHLLASGRADWPAAVRCAESACELEKSGRTHVALLESVHRLGDHARVASILLDIAMNFPAETGNYLKAVDGKWWSAVALYSDAARALAILREAAPEDPWLVWQHAELADQSDDPHTASVLRNECRDLLDAAVDYQHIDLRMRCELAEGQRRAAHLSFGELVEAVRSEPDEHGVRAMNRQFRMAGSVEVLASVAHEVAASIDGNQFDLATATMEAAIVAGEIDLALGIFASLPQRVGPGDYRYQRLASWVAAHTGQTALARALFGETIWPKGSANFADLGSDTLSVLSPANGRAGQPSALPVGATPLFSRCRDEIGRLPSFLNHYRTLGVSHFFMVDNGSQDGSFEYLLDQSDCFVFRAETLFHESGAGARWINHLVDQYAASHWCVFADVDEHLVIPGIASLSAAIADFNKSGVEFLGAVTIDLFPESPTDLRPSTSAEHPLAKHCYFDNDYELLGNIDAPYIDIVGGVRRRLVPADSHPQLAKTPLMNCGKGFRQLHNTHVCQPGKRARQTGAMLHFKWATDAANRRLFPYHEIRQQRGLAVDGETLLGPASIKFESASQLANLGLLSE